MAPDTIRKRNGQIVCFDTSKIHVAVEKALAAVGNSDIDIPKDVAANVAANLTEEVPTVEQIQDEVERVLIRRGHVDTAKAYILYRDERNRIRDEKLHVLNADSLDDVSLKMPLNSLRVLVSRYLLRNADNKISESPSDMFKRVAATVTLSNVMYDGAVFDLSGNQSRHDPEPRTDETMADTCMKIGEYGINRWHVRSMRKHYERLDSNGQMKLSFGEVCELLRTGKFDSYSRIFDRAYSLMTGRMFLPNSPTLMNAGCRLGQLSACFVLGMDDSLDSIMDVTKEAAVIFQSGGGVGVNYSNLRQEGSMVASTSGVASGPVSFMNIINAVTEVVKQGGKRRGANMGILESWHPDIKKFIEAKSTPGVLENFNVSVGTWEDFWHAVQNGGTQALRAPDGEKKGEIDANELLDLISMSAWDSAEPGLLFFDRANEHNVLRKARGEPLRATNPCGEQMIYPNESCNLGSINVGKFVDANGGFDWDGYVSAIRDCTDFLDGVVDANVYPTEDTQKASMETRRIGLGMMGLADCLALMGIRYDSAEGYGMMARLCEYLTFYSMERSVCLAQERGKFDLCDKTDYAEGKLPVSGAYAEVPRTCDWAALSEKIIEFGLRNVVTTTIAPTGTLAMIASCSNGMEPFYSMVYQKKVKVGTFQYVNEMLAKSLEAAGIDVKKIMEKIQENGGSLQGISGVPQQIKDAFRTAMDMHWADHVMAQAVCQDWIGNSISKTINMPKPAKFQDVKAAYVLAHAAGLNGITIYRDGSRATQVLYGGNGSVTSPTGACLAMAKKRLMPGDMQHMQGLFGPDKHTCVCGATLVCAGGCRTCYECGRSSCSSA